MSFEWTAHRFSGGLLALDLVNTVVCRAQPARRSDRFSDFANVKPFCEAAGRFRAVDVGGKTIAEPDGLERLIDLREAINDWIRPVAQGGETSAIALGRLFEAAASCMREESPAIDGVPLGQAAAMSAMQLFNSDLRRQVKICPNCDWLFIDRSKNRSRVWCDMQVCGNRAKAGKHYLRRKGKGSLQTETAR
jgi:predicted RNA-binding Zn ribbon-like protein